MSKHTDWFMHERFGMFIHWGLYTIHARDCLIRSYDCITPDNYNGYLAEFNPTGFNAKEWAVLAKKAGMKYAILTAKHHEGFCLFDSKYTDYKSTNTPCGRDLVAEFVEAFRAEGIKVGLYYSVIDWIHEDYPHYSDSVHPCRNNENYRDEGRDFDRYLDYMFKQIEELCCNYGKIDLMWFDYSYDNMKGETWRATELIKMVRSYQPDVVINNRLEVSGEEFGSLITGEPSTYAGDFISPEMIIPTEPLRNAKGELIPWETCMSINNSWGYHIFDKEFKNPKLIINKLVECVSKGGNLLLNVGPDPRGYIPDEVVPILSEVGDWMRRNGESIYGCSVADISKPETGRITRNGKKIYVHFNEGCIGPLCVRGIKREDIKYVRLLSDMARLEIVDSWATKNYPDCVFIGIGPEALFTYNLPDDKDTVILIELK